MQIGATTGAVTSTGAAGAASSAHVCVEDPVDELERDEPFDSQPTVARGGRCQEAAEASRVSSGSLSVVGASVSTLSPCCSASGPSRRIHLRICTCGDACTESGDGKEDQGGGDLGDRWGGDEAGGSVSLDAWWVEAHRLDPRIGPAGWLDSSGGW